MDELTSFPMRGVAPGAVYRASLPDDDPPLSVEGEAIDAGSDSLKRSTGRAIDDLLILTDIHGRTSGIIG